VSLDPDRLKAYAHTASIGYPLTWQQCVELTNEIRRLQNVLQEIAERADSHYMVEREYEQALEDVVRLAVYEGGATVLRPPADPSDLDVVIAEARAKALTEAAQICTEKGDRLTDLMLDHMPQDIAYDCAAQIENLLAP
jgi:hypothetical protein